MKRLLSILGVAVLLSFGLFTGKSIVAPQEAGACGWYRSSLGPIVHIDVWDGKTAMYTTVYGRAEVQSDGCVGRIGHMWMWTQNYDSSRMTWEPSDTPRGYEVFVNGGSFAGGQWDSQYETWPADFYFLINTRNYGDVMTFDTFHPTTNAGPGACWSDPYFAPNRGCFFINA